MTDLATAAVTIHRISTRLGALHVNAVGTGRPALLWHGMFVDGDSWQRMSPRLAAERRLIVVDGPGHGRSDPLRRDTTVDECAAVAAEVLDALRITDPVDWVGNAWGGHVGLAVARRDRSRLRSLVAVSSPPAPIGADLRRKIGLLGPLLRIVGFRGPVLDGVLSSQLSDAGRADAQIAATMATMLRRARPASMSRALRSFVLSRTDVTPTLSQLTVPTLFVGTDDRGEFGAEQAQDAARRTPDARAAVITGARTLAPLEQPDRLASEILGFWHVVDGSAR